MKALICSLVLANLAVGGGQPRGILAPIALYHEFLQEPSPAVKAALQNELQSIMTPLGLRFEWRDLHGGRDNQPTIELAVISFKGRCDASGIVQHNPKPGALGWTHISNGSILPFSDVDCDGVRAFLQRGLLAVPAGDRQQAYGRALARVLAHELYHIFADTTRHGSFGIGKEAYTVRDLLSSDFRFQDQETKALKNSKAYESLERGFDLP